jgi:predicted DCC family thiol-disulfide oxidoreductase YuxK
MPVVLFDGVCNFCNSTVAFIIDHDPHGHFQFAALQSEAARPFLERCALPARCFDALVLVEEEKCYTRSTAALHIFRRLGQPWFLLYGLIVVPRPLRDAFYRWFAANRYRWFGKRDECSMPGPTIRQRFLELPIGPAKK